MNASKCSSLYCFTVLTLALGCDAGRTTAPSSPAASAAVSDGANSGNQHFFFLPPMVKAPVYNGAFDAEAAPVVEICKLEAASACGAALIASYSMTSGPGGEVVKVDPIAEHYQVKWRTADFTLDDGAVYRVNVRQNAFLLGFADVQLFTSSQQARNNAEDQTIALLDGHILNIKFRIERGTGITIDARALTAPSLEIPNVRTFSPANVQQLALEPGEYLLRYHTGGLAGPGDASFSVSVDNTISYSAALDNILSGRGTSTLTVKGAVISVDLTALTAPVVDMPGVSSSDLSTREIQTVTLLPGGHLIRYHTGALSGLGSVEYRVLDNGTIDYALSLDGILSGRGTSALAVNGSVITIDLRALTAPVVDMPGVSRSDFSTLALQTVTLLPGGHLLRYHTGALSGLASGEYRVLSDGKLEYAPSMDGVFAGRGGTDLGVTGVVIAVDATALSAPRVDMPGVSRGDFVSSDSHTLTLLPGGHQIRYLTATGVASAEYRALASGTVDYAVSLDGVFSGRATPNLRVDGLPLFVNATAQPPGTFVLSGIGTFENTEVQPLRVLPGGHRFESSPLTFNFLMNAAGSIEYAAELEAFLSGSGTNSLTVR